MFAKAIAALKDWSGVLALFLVLSGGVAYAVNTVGSADVIDNSLLSADLKDGKAVQGVDVKDHSLSGADVASESVGGSRITDGTITGADVSDGSLSGADLGTGSVGRDELRSGGPLGVISFFEFSVPANGCQTKVFGDDQADLGEVLLAQPESSDLGAGVFMRPTVVSHPGEGVLEICNTTGSPVTIPFGTFFDLRLIG